MPVKAKKPTSRGDDRGRKASAVRRMHFDGFVDAFVRIHGTMKDRRFAFVLGAGASRSSGIKTGDAFAREWLQILYRRDPERGELGFDDWLQQTHAHIPELAVDRPAESYPQVYAATFQADPDEGYAYLEDAMKAADPGYGYAVLAYLLEQTAHKVVITVNFDNLVADALANYASTFPLVCGHDSLAGFAKPNLRRPLVLKIHHDLFLAPRSRPDELGRIGPGYQQAVERLLQQYTPIVIGYGGNDGSLMKVLEDLPANSVPGGIYWCYWNGEPEPREQIKQVVARQNGWLVPIPGFDEVMTLIGEQVGFALPDARIRERAAKRADQLVKHAQDLRERLKKPVTPEGGPVGQGSPPGGGADLALGALQRTLLREDGLRRWWQWEELASAEQDPAKREAIYQQALKELPDSAPLLGNYAVFMSDVRKDRDRAEELYGRALRADPNQANNLGNYAVFLENVRKDYDRAEEFYNRALEADPTHGGHLGNFALFLERVRKQHDRAEELYERGLEADPDDANNLGNYALFLENVRKDYDLAEEFYSRAIQADPTHAGHLGNFALFLDKVRKQHDRAEELYERALQADPNNAINLGNYALFLKNVREHYDRTEELFERAVHAEPSNAINLGNYAVFLETVREQHDRAEELYQRAILADPEGATNLGNYADFLEKIRKDYDRASELYERALHADPIQANILGNYANFLAEVRRDYDRAQELFQRAIQADPKHPSNLGSYALLLEKVRKDHDRAEALYERALQADPNHANNLGNYAQLLLARGDREKGIEYVGRAISVLGDEPNPALRVELAFYEFAHRAEEPARRAALKRLKNLIIDQGASSPGWDLSRNVDRAVRDVHPEAAWLAKLASVVSGEADPGVLNPWSAWADA